MSTETLKVEVRPAVGSQANRKLRRTGQVPAILYGHGQENVNLSVSSEALGTALRHHSRLVQLEGGVNESALIKDLAYDTYGMEVLHVDFTRVSMDERIEVEVAVELKGTSLGAKSGGVIIHSLHEVLVECLAVAIPEKLILNVSSLDKGGELYASSIELPEGVKLLTDAEEIVVRCDEPGKPEDIAAVAGGAEPEIIKRKVDEEGAEDAK